MNGGGRLVVDVMAFSSSESSGNGGGGDGGGDSGGVDAGDDELELDGNGKFLAFSRQ